MEPNPNRQDMARKARAAASEKMSGLWWTFMLRGSIFLALGLVALFWPSGSVSMLLRVFGFFLAVEGLANLFGARRTQGQMTETAPAVLSAVLGVALLFLPAASIGLAFIILGFWAGVTGFGYLATWWAMPKHEPERDTTRNIGIIACLGGLILIFWPGSGSVALGWTLACLAFVVAAIMFFLASRFKKVDDRISR